MKLPRPNRFISLLFIIGLPIILLITAAIGLMDTPDSYLYFILAGYLKTGRIGWVAPFNYHKPQTLFGPVYGLFGSSVGSLIPNWGIAGLAFMQLLLILVGAIFVYVLLKKFVSRSWAAVGSLIFLVLPFNIIFGTLIMSEILTQFFVGLYIVILYYVVQKKSSWFKSAAPLVLIATIATLTRYAYLPLILLGIILCFYFVPKKVVDILCLAVSAGLLLWWVNFNHQTNGVWSLTVVAGRHVYNSAVYQSHLLPPNNAPITKIFLKYFHSRDNFWKPWWTNQNLFANDPKLPEWKIDQWYTQISLITILAHPVAFTWHVIKNVAALPGTVPYLRPNYIESYRTCDISVCHVPWIPPICQPPVLSCTAQKSWGTFIDFSNFAQPVVGSFFMILAFMGVIISIRKRSLFLLVTAGVFFIMYVSQAAMEVSEGRFLIPLYPMEALFITIALQWISQKTRHISKHASKT